MIKSVGQMASSPVDLAKIREGGKARAASAMSLTGEDAKVAGSGALTSLAQMASAGAPVDTDRVAAIKEAIASGKYPVNAERIAERMIALDLGE